MKVLETMFVTEHGTSLGVEKQAVVVKQEDGTKTRVPMAALERIVLLGRVRMSDQLMERCTRRGIRISSLSRSGRMRYHIGSPTSGNVVLRVHQVEAFNSDERSARIARSIVAGKLRSSRVAIQRWKLDSARSLELERIHTQMSQRLDRLASAEELEVIRGIEGDGARLYFKALGRVLGASGTGFVFDSRSRRPPRDPANALLSFAYSLATTAYVGALESVGLDPQIGFLHRIRPGRPSMALDLVEEARPAIADRFVVSLIRRRQIHVRDLVEIPGGGWKLDDEGRRRFLKLWDEYLKRKVHHPFLSKMLPMWSIPYTQSILAARHLRGDLKEYPAWYRVQ